MEGQKKNGFLGNTFFVPKITAGMMSLPVSAASRPNSAADPYKVAGRIIKTVKSAEIEYILEPSQAELVA